MNENDQGEDADAEIIQRRELDPSGYKAKLRQESERLKQESEGILLGNLPSRFDHSKMGCEPLINYMRRYIHREAMDLWKAMDSQPIQSFDVSDHPESLRLAILLQHLSEVVSRLDQVRGYAWDHMENRYMLI